MHGLGKPKLLVGIAGRMHCMVHRYYMYDKNLLTPPGGETANFRVCKDITSMEAFHKPGGQL